MGDEPTMVAAVDGLTDSRTTGLTSPPAEPMDDAGDEDGCRHVGGVPVDGLYVM